MTPYPTHLTADELLRAAYINNDPLAERFELALWDEHFHDRELLDATLPAELHNQGITTGAELETALKAASKDKAALEDITGSLRVLCRRLGNCSKLSGRECQALVNDVQSLLEHPADFRRWTFCDKKTLTT